MAYTYDNIFAKDPGNAANVASNASITIFDPADPSMTPIAITDTTGSPLPNPITVDAFGFGPAFQHATLDRVGWFGAGFSNYFTSYEGMKAVAMEAAAAAEDAALEAAASALLAQAPTDTQVDEGIVRADLPAIAADVVANDPSVVSSAATMAQSTVGLVPAWKASTVYTAGQRVISPSGDVVAAKVNFTSGATYNAGNWNTSTQDARTSVLEAKAGLADLITNGSFRDGLNGWGATTGWVAESNTITSWARAATGAAGLLTQSIVVPANLLGRTLRLKVLVDCTSTGTYRSLVTTTAGNTDLSHVLGTGPWAEKTLDIPIPVGQGTTPINVQVGRSAGNVYMTSVRLEAL